MVTKRVTGLDKVLRKLNKEIKAIEGRTMKGLIRAQIIIRRDMDKTPPKIPVGKTGDLRASYETKSYYMGNNPVVLMAFTASYAWFVHEMIGKKIKWNREGSGPKFLEASIKRNTAKVLAVIREEAMIKS